MCTDCIKAGATGALSECGDPSLLFLKSLDRLSQQWRPLEDCSLAASVSEGGP